MSKTKLLCIGFILSLLFSLVFASSLAWAYTGDEYGGTNANGSAANPDGDNDGYGDNIAFSVPSAINFVMAADGELIGPSNAEIRNEGTGQIGVSAVKVTPNSGWNIVDDASTSNATNSVDFQFGPVGKEINAVNYLAKADVSYNDWQAKATTPLSIGVSGSAAKINASVASKQSIGTIEWYVKQNYGEAYAVLDANGLLTLFRSYDNLSAGTGQTVSDIMGNTYTGEVFVGVENTGTTSSSVPWSSKRASIKKVDIADGQTIKPAQTAHWFKFCANAIEIDLAGLDTSNVTSMRGMFSNCSSLTSLDVTNFDTSNVTDMVDMFSSCSSLTSLDMSNFDTSNVMNMNLMFYDCSSLTSLDMSNFDTSNVTNMEYMFSNCSSLITLDVSNFDTSNITNMVDMFCDCSSLTSLDISNFDTSNVTNMGGMFSGCSSLTALDLSNFNTSNVTDMDLMFSNCSSLTTIYANDWYDSSRTIDSTGMFFNCASLVGGNGTTHYFSYVDWQRALIDKAGQVGYFTDPASRPTSSGNSLTTG